MEESPEPSPNKSDSNLQDGEEIEHDSLDLGKDSDIEIRPPNKTIPPPPICVRYFEFFLKFI